jgi:phosphatidylglycerol:prolipoprotein diacylglycerol transferase
VPTAAIAFDFSPLIRFGDQAVRLDTVVIALGILAALLVATLIAVRTPVADDRGAFIQGERLRVDDLVFIVLATIPGAVIGGRIGQILVHLDYYGAHPGAIVDPSRGSLELGLAVVGGALTGTYAARLLGESAGRWLHVAAIPTLLAIAVGKLALAFGGGGQGMPSDLPWATSYAGPGPWNALLPALPSHPAQLYEAGTTAGVLVLTLVALAAGRFGRRDGSAFFVAIALWAVARVVVASTWRDAPVAGPLRADQILSLAVAVGCVSAAALVGRRAHAPRLAAPEPAWPDPETRPRF